MEKKKKPSTKNKSLVIVESPTKAKTITKILGSDYAVVSSMGHLIDLPAKELGVDIANGFAPEYVVIPGRQKVITALKKEGKDKDTIYIATDPDREGEAIGWQLREQLFKKKKVRRVLFHEITAPAVREAFKHPRDFDEHMIEAQAGRRILDRIVGYFLSPLLWKKIARGLSAGRVQSVALRLIIDRERAIQAFIPQEYWEVEAELCKQQDARSNSFTVKLAKIDDKKIEIKNQETAEGLVSDIKQQQFVVSDIKKTVKRRNPQPPFITSTLQQEAFNRLRFNATKTMIVAQQLYEGIDIGEAAPVGLITYMRTDSPRVAPEAINEVRDFIGKRFGKQYLPDEPNVYKVKKLAQEAHEAVRPSAVARSPETLRNYLSPEQFKLYELIYNRFVASQMMPAEYLVTTVEITAGRYQFNGSGSTITFDGFMAVYNKNEEDEVEPDNDNEKKKNEIPPLEKNEVLELISVIPSQHFTKPPARFSDSSLVKALEDEGIGRPSTYAPIITTLLQRDYVRRIRGYFQPTELGFTVCDLLVEYFPKIMDVKFTALMEEELDEVEEGTFDKQKVLTEFFTPFKENLDFAQTHIKKEVITTKEVCEKCGKPMIMKWGRKGKFLSCSAYPQCKFAKSITSGVACPQQGCDGELIERRSRRGFFYGCSRFPTCTYTSKTLPDADKSEESGKAI
ncbi:MAG: type I DNA topoisomerase [Candidatus Omnitrophica bacterium]|nr:type I DNA topoisomerase [Candidatus Omnitrophota bacterium]